MSKDTDVNCQLIMTEEPAKNALALVKGLIVPMLNRKMQVCGLEDSEQVFRDTLYLLFQERLNVLGLDAMDEICHLLQEAEVDFLKAQKAIFTEPMVPRMTYDFYEVDGKPS